MNGSLTEWLCIGLLIREGNLNLGSNPRRPTIYNKTKRFHVYRNENYMKKVKFLSWYQIRDNIDAHVFTFFRYIGSLPLAADMIIIKYNDGSFLPEHKDPLDGFNCYRINFTFNTGHGGELKSDKFIFNSKYLKIFRPDANFHSVSKVVNGTRWVFSLGLAVKKK